MRKILSFVAAMLIAFAANATTWNITPTHCHEGDRTDGYTLYVTLARGAQAGDTIVLADGTYLEGQSMPINNAVVIKAAEGANPVIQMSGYFQVHASAEFEGLKFKFVGEASNGYCMYFYENTSKYLKLEGCEFQDFTQYCVSSWEDYHIDSCIVNNCYFHDLAKAPFYFAASSLENNVNACDKLKVTNSTFANIAVVGYVAVLDIRNNSGNVTGATSKLEVDHCTFYNCQGDYERMIQSYKSPDATVSNCIMMNPIVEGKTEIYATYLYGGSIHHNLNYQTKRQYGSGVTVTDSIQRDPLFVNAATLDLHLGEGSPALGAGSDGSNLGDPRWWPAPAPVEPLMKTIYCKMDKAWWTADGAAIGLYTWDGTTTTPKAAWPGERMTPVEGEDGLWSFELDINTYPMCIFTRVNPTGDIADWGAKSGDLVIPTDDNDLYTITSETAVWGDPGVAGAWSKYEPAQPILGTHFVKVTEAPADWAGEYLIVFETADTAHASVAMNGGLDAFDVASNGVAVSIEDNKIAVSEALLAAKFTIAAMNGGYSIKGASGKFIGAASYANSLLSSDTAIANVLSIADNKAVIAVNVMNQGNPAQVTMRYNYAKDQLRFRYYKSGQQPVALYKLTTVAPEPTHTYTVAGAPAAVFGEEWNASYEENDMEFLANQSYTWIKDSVVLRAGTTVQFKVVEDHAWAKAWPEQNYQLAIPEDGYYSIIIAFNLAADPDSVVEAKAVKVGEIEPAPEYSLWNVVSTTDTTHAVKYIDNEYLEVKTVYQGTVVAQNAVIFDETFTHAIQVRADAYPSATDPIGTVKAGSTPLVFTAKQDASIAIYYMRQAVNKAWSDNDNKDIILFDQAAPTVKIAAAKMEADSVYADSSYYFMAKSYNLQAGHTYTLTAKGTTIKLFGISYPAVPEPQHTYTVAGAPTTLFGKEWNASYAENDMESYGTDTYFWRRDSVALAAGNVEFKIVEDHGWAKGWPDKNYVIKIDSAGIYNITIMFKPKAADPDSMISVVVYKVGDAVVLPKIILHGNFTGSWADTEEFAIAEDNLTASLRLGLEAKAYEFGMKFDGVWKANGANITREAPSACLATGDGNMHITADQAGEYIFTYTFATQTLEVAYPKLIPHYGVHEAIAAAADSVLVKDDLVYIRGIVTKIEFKGANFKKYGSACIYVADASGAADTLEFYNCYSMNADTFKTSDPAYDATSTAWAQFNSVADANGVEIALGDTIEAFGKYNLYNGVHQLNQGCYLTVVNKYVAIPEIALIGGMNGWDGNQGKFAPAADYKSAAWTINLDTLPADRGYAFKLLVDGIAMGSARDSAGNPFTFTPANNVLRPVDHVAVGDDEIFWLHMEDKVGEYTFIYTFADSSLKVVYPKVLPTTAPAAPTVAEDDVMALYCNHYATNNLHFEILGWGGVQTWKADTIDGVAIAYCEDMKYEFLTNWGAPKYDMSEYNKIHIDIWAPAAASVRLGIEALGVGEGGSGSKVGVVYNLNEGWNSIDAALEDFGYDFKDMKYVFFEWYKTPEGESFENNPFGFANIYFFKEAQGLNNTVDGVKAQKYIHNGMILIEKNGKVYTITGQVVR